ncbi:MAG: flagellar biosynthetic protein FliO [Proteobacteria bacterium]|nr:flagellar biosynthetic protein FliO [Pseudomonadota bacterium]
MFAAPPSLPAAQTGGVSELAHVALALILVLALVLVLAAVVRRVRGLSPRPSQLMEVLADVPVGAKERAVLVRVGGTQLLLGVAPGRVSALHVLAEGAASAATAPAATPAAAPVAPTFQSILRRSLGL